MLYKAYSYGLRSLRKYHNTLKAHEYALQVVCYVFVCPKVSVENEPPKRHRQAQFKVKVCLTVSFLLPNATNPVPSDAVSGFSVPDGQRCRCWTNELIFHLEHYSCKTVTGAHLFHPSLPSFVISTERSEWRYPYRFHIKSIVSCTTCNAQNICSDLLKSMLRH